MNWQIISYRLRMKLFRWIQDEDGDIGLSMFGGLIVFIKYKEHTLVKWLKSDYQDAEKWQGHREEED